jgi:hypothetical protein
LSFTILGPEKEIEEKLEDQFKQGLEHKLIAGPKATPTKAHLSYQVRFQMH